MRRRAQYQEETRRRIIEAALALHRALGPAQTSLSAVAEAAGVQRHTLYRHFPTPEALFRACGERFAVTSRRPDPDRWSALPPSPERSLTILSELYDWYARNQDAIGNALRDSELVPVGGGVRRMQQAAVELLASASGKQRAVARMVVDFGGWRALTEDGRLAAHAAARLALKLLDSATGLAPER